MTDQEESLARKEYLKKDLQAQLDQEIAKARETVNLFVISSSSDITNLIANLMWSANRMAQTEGAIQNLHYWKHVNNI